MPLGETLTPATSKTDNAYELLLAAFALHPRDERPERVDRDRDPDTRTLGVAESHQTVDVGHLDAVRPAAAVAATTSTALAPRSRVFDHRGSRSNSSITLPISAIESAALTAIPSRCPNISVQRRTSSESSRYRLPPGPSV